MGHFMLAQPQKATQADALTKKKHCRYDTPAIDDGGKVAIFSAL